MWMNLIKHYRKNIANINQSDLANELRSAGICKCRQKDISRWEHGLHMPDIDVLKYLAELINVTVDDLRINIINSKYPTSVKIKRYVDEIRQYKII